MSGGSQDKGIGDSQKITIEIVASIFIVYLVGTRLNNYLSPNIEFHGHTSLKISMFIKSAGTVRKTLGDDGYDGDLQECIVHCAQDDQTCVDSC